MNVQTLWERSHTLWDQSHSWTKMVIESFAVPSRTIVVSRSQEIGNELRGSEFKRESRRLSRLCKMSLLDSFSIMTPDQSTLVHLSLR
jgi:hypothetical protein